MNNRNIYHRIVDLIVPIPRVAFIHKDIIEQNLKIQEMQVLLLKKGASDNKLKELNEKARKLSLTTKSSYYEILEDLVNKEISVINKIPGSQK